MGLPGARSLENWTEMVEPSATLVPVGVVDTTVSALGGDDGAADALSCDRFTRTRPPATRARHSAASATNNHTREWVPESCACRAPLITEGDPTSGFGRSSRPGRPYRRFCL